MHSFDPQAGRTRSRRDCPRLRKRSSAPSTTEERWLIDELLRMKDELQLPQGVKAVAAKGEGHFRQALDWVRRQDASKRQKRFSTRS